MTGQYPNNPNLRWHELLSRAEIQQWLSTGIAPPRLLVDFDKRCATEMRDRREMRDKRCATEMRDRLNNP